MSGIQVLDRHRILLSQPAGGFSDKEIFTAKCLGFTTESKNRIIVNIQQTSKTALFEFLKYAYYQLMNLQSYAGLRNSYFAKIKKMYDDDYADFMQRYNPLELYRSMDKEMYAHQVEVLWLYRHKRLNLLCFEQGLGKTLTAATVSRIFQIRRTVIVGPNLVKWNWVMDLSEDWGYNSMYFTVYDRKKTVKAFMREAFVIVNYEMIDKFWDDITGDEVGHIIIDEVHYAKNPRTRRFKNVQRLIDQFPKARVTLLTGTPVTNRIIDLYAYLKLCKHPLGVISEKDFIGMYAIGKIRSKITGVKNVGDLRLKISNFIVRKKSDECLDLPELRISKYYFDLDDYRKEYDEAMEEIYNKNKEYRDLGKRIDELTALDDIYYAGKIKILKAERRAVRTNRTANLNTLNRICATSKVPKMIEVIDNLIAQGEKVIVFGSYKKPLQLIRDHYGQLSVYIDGSVTAFKRQQLIDKFKKDNDNKVFIGQVIAAGIGINLVNARKVLFTNFPYTPDQLEQPYKRAHRSGQKRNVDVIYTICKDTVDEHIYHMLKNKLDDINETIDHGKEIVEYGNLEEKLFNSLLQDYEKKHNLETIVKPEPVDGFVKVK